MGVKCRDSHNASLVGKNIPASRACFILKVKEISKGSVEWTQLFPSLLTMQYFIFASTPGRNRTHNCPLGGGCYIHLTTRAYKQIQRTKLCICIFYKYFFRSSTLSSFSHGRSRDRFFRSGRRLRSVCKSDDEDPASG